MSGVLGVLLAGGRSERFGAPKALAIFRGRTLLDRAREELAAVCDVVVVVAPAGAALPLAAGERVADALPLEGPLSALVAGLEARPFTRALALAVDLPLLERGHLARLRDEAGEEAALVPAPEGRPQPLAGVYAARAAAPLRAALDRGVRAVTDAVRSLGPRLLDDAALERLGVPARLFADADTPEALARLESVR